MKIKKLVDKHFIWQSKQPNQKLKSFKCKYCTATYAEHATRMSVHLINCKGCPDSVKTIVREQTNITEPSTTIQCKRKRSNSLSDLNFSHDRLTEEKVNRPSEKKEKMYDFWDKMTSKDQTHADKLLAKAIYSSGTFIYFLYCFF